MSVKFGGILDYITPGRELTVDEVIADAAVRAELVAHEPVIIQDGRLSYPYPQQLPQDLKDIPANALQGLTVAAVSKVAREATESWLCGKCER